MGSERQGILGSFLLIWLSSVLFASLVLVPAWWLIVRSETNALLIQEQGTVRQSAANSVREISYIISDLNLLGQSPALRSWIEVGEPWTFTDFRQELAKFHFEKWMYDQVRLLDVNGREIARSRIRNEFPVMAAKGELQDKSDRRYFQEASQIDPWDAWISPMELNVERGQVERPYKPVMRFSMPVANSQGEVRGFLVLNYRGSHIIDELMAPLKNSVGSGMVVNKDGFWLHAPQMEDGWGFMLPHGRRFQDDHPQVWKEMSENDSGIITRPGRRFIFATIHPVAQVFQVPGEIQQLRWARENVRHYRWKVIVSLDDAAFPRFLSFQSASVFAALLAGLGVLSLFLARARESHRRSDAALGQSEEHFRNLIEGSVQGILITRENQPLFANDEFARIFGYGGKEEILAIGDTLNFVAPEDHERLIPIREARRPGKENAQIFELRGLRKDGTRIWLEVRSQIVNWQGQPANQSTVGDITGRKNAEAELRKLNQELEERVEMRTALLSRANEELSDLQSQLSAALEAISDGFSMFDAQDRLVLFNANLLETYPGFADLLKLGVAFEEIVREGVARGLYPAAVGREEGFITERMAAHRNPGSFEQELEEGKWVEVREFRTADGGYVSTRRNITARKKAELALQTSEERFRNFAESAADWFWEMDAELRFSYISPNIGRILGIEPGFFHGLTRRDLLGEGYDEAQWGEHMEILKARKPFRDFVYRREVEGTTGRWLSSSGNPIFDDAGTFLGYRGSGRDVTAQKEAETELTQHREQLEDLVTLRTTELQQTNKHLLTEIRVRRDAEEAAREANRAKSVFLATMSHELRTPLNAIIGYAELVREEMADAGVEGFNADLSNIRTAGLHLLGMINEILDLSKIEAGQMELEVGPFEFCSVANEAISTVTPQAARRGNHFKLVGMGEEIFMRSDAKKVRQVILNLLSNAAKFTEEGKITLEISKVQDNGTESVVFSVSDTGVGISEEDQTKVFREFTQVDASTTRKSEGTGLGLAISKRICEMLGGEIGLESELGRGSVFTVRLPVELQPPS